MSNDLDQELRVFTSEAVKSLFGQNVEANEIVVNVTRKEFEGDLSVVVFPFTKFSKKSPEQTATAIGEFIKEKWPIVSHFNVVKGFLNMVFTDQFWLEYLKGSLNDHHYGKQSHTNTKVVLEYCGPNTNKPLHLGHIRNMVIGYAMANIREAAGDEVHKVNIYNDRGIAICKSMLAWQKFGNGETPKSSGIKGDHLIGKYYVEFDRAYREQIEELKKKGLGDDEAKKEAPIIKEAQEMLRKWEAGDPETLQLWSTMNGWVYEGFEETFGILGVDFEKDYYESEMYLRGKDLVKEGLDKGIFYKKPDNSVWVDLTDAGLDEKVLLRSDGTSVYLTQDLGTAQARYEDYKMDESIYVVANEQDYHFKALKLTLQKLREPFADGIHHLSYGMVDLPTGKMKSREGTTVDADDLVQEMMDTAETHTKELGKIEGFTEEEAKELYRKLGLGALKYFLLRVNPKKRILFEPEESIQFQGDTGPFIQYTYARIQSVLRKWEVSGRKGSLPEVLDRSGYTTSLDPLEREIILLIQRYPLTIREAAQQYDPSQIANYVYNLAKAYNKFYAELSILNADDDNTAFLRIRLSEMTARVIKSAMKLLGIEVPDRM